MKRDSLKRRGGRISSIVLAAAVVIMPRLVVQAADDNAPQIVDTTPKQGGTDVHPGLTEISVTFDRDMSQGMSWTGAAPLMPAADEPKQARWTDARTCVLPVKLEGGKYYRVGINSSRVQNFRSLQDVPAASSVICFATQGADEATKRRIEAPTIVKFEPANGAQDVDPTTKWLSVTFNTPMASGMSWTHSGPNFPGQPAGTKPAWSEDRLTCTMQVALEPGHEYEIGLNHPQFNNFQSEWGVPLVPVAYKFRTAGSSAVAEKPAEATTASKAHPIEIKASQVREYPSLKVEFGALRLELTSVTVAPIDCEVGVTGVVLLGTGTYRYAPEPDKVFEGMFRGGMLRFNPKDQRTILALDAGQGTGDEGFAELSRHVLNVVFRHCWHSGMQALIPPEGAMAAVLYTKEHGDLLVSWSGDTALATSVTTHTRLYDKKK